MNEQNHLTNKLFSSIKWVMVALLLAGVMIWSTADTVAQTNCTLNDDPALVDLQGWLVMSPDQRPQIDTQPFATQPLSRETAANAQCLILADHIVQFESIHGANFDNDQLVDGDATLRFVTKKFGDQSTADGPVLVISMHGGLPPDAAFNDQQWANQQQMYNDFPNDYVLIIPRAPFDVWNGWFVPRTENLFYTLIRMAEIRHGINSDKVILVGYSAGGDGVYELAPRMADRLSAVAMFAGTPNGSNPFNLHPVTFVGRIGENDTAFNRNNELLNYETRLDDLASLYGGGYSNDIALAAGLGHWMNSSERDTFPMMFAAERDTNRPLTFWRQHQNENMERTFFHNISANVYRPGGELIVNVDGQTVSVVESDYEDGELTVYLRDETTDLDMPVTLLGVNGETLFSGLLPRTINTIWTTTINNADTQLVYTSQLVIEPAAGENPPPTHVTVTQTVSTSFSTVTITIGMMWCAFLLLTVWFTDMRPHYGE